METVEAPLVRDSVVEALTLFVQSTEHLHVTFAHAILAEARADHGPDVRRVEFSADSSTFAVNVVMRDGSVIERDEPNAPLVVTCGVYFTALGAGSFYVDADTAEIVVSDDAVA